MMPSKQTNAIGTHEWFFHEFCDVAKVTITHRNI